MSNQKLLPAQLKELDAIKRNGGEKPALEALAMKWNQANGWNMTYNQIYQRWHYRNPKHKQKRAYKKRQSNGIDASPRVKVVIANDKKVVAYTLEKGVQVTARGDQSLKLEVMKKLKPGLMAMGIRVHTIPIYTSDIRAFKELVAQPEFKAMVFGITKIPDNPKMVRIYRKL